VLDEAHRGMKEGGRAGDGGRPTIVRQLINGTGSVPGIPVVWGISATVERFDEAIRGMKGHATLPNVIVDPRRVQESGLLKDTINLDVSDDTGDVSTVLLRRGTDKLREISEAWSTYAKEQGEREAVLPLMVFQVPNLPLAQDIAGWLDVIFERWPELPHDCVGNVFGEHRTETYGPYSVPYVAPERVQESKRIRVLLAKDAISTGWDCPRAEVMVYRHAARILSPDLARSYSEYLAQKATGGEITEDALIDAHTTVAALGLVPDVRSFLETEAEKLASQWLNQFRIPLKNLKDERQEVYRELAAMSVEPQDISLALPRSRLQATTIRETNGGEMPLPRFEKHLLCDADRLFPERFNGWESDVIAAESGREGFVAWYRNPSRTSPESLGVAYGPGNDQLIMRPDFIFFACSPTGEIVADIVDPHSFQYEDALPKLRGLAQYAESSRGEAFRRIDAVAKVGAVYRVLDMKEGSVRDAVLRATSAPALYSSDAAADYLI
jgi:hypothetical protein